MYSKSGIFHIRQSWVDVTDYDRPVHVHVPQGAGPYPVYIALHGKYGSGESQLMNLKRMTGRILIAPMVTIKAGAQKTFMDFIRQIIKHLKNMEIVDDSNIVIHGSSNGAGLWYRLMIELEEGLFHHGISSIGGMTVDRYDEKISMGSRGAHNKTPIAAREGNKVLQINGTDDQIVPYKGGTGTRGLSFCQLRTLFITGQYTWGKKGAKLADSQANLTLQITS